MTTSNKTIWKNILAYGGTVTFIIFWVGITYKTVGENTVKIEKCEQRYDDLVNEVATKEDIKQLKEDIKFWIEHTNKSK